MQREKIETNYKFLVFLCLVYRRKIGLTIFPLFQSISYITTGISKTVFNPAAAAMAARAKAQASLSSPTAVKAADFVSKMEKVKQMDAMKKVC
jgi:hypothetical protein